MGEIQVARDYVAIARQYADDVVTGKVEACRWVQLACKRAIDDWRRRPSKRWAYRFDDDAAVRACEFIEDLPHVKGEWAKETKENPTGQLITMQPWQVFIVVNLFGWLCLSDGTRRFREAYIEVPRKNGKSILAAAIGLYMLVADGEVGAEVYSGATSEEQAWEIFRPAKQMAEKAVGFADFFGLDVKAKSMIAQDGGRFKPIIGNPGDGASPSCSLVDEYHEHDTDDLHDTMLTGMGSRTQPLQFVITTAGDNLGGPCYAKRQDIEKLLQKVYTDHQSFGMIFTLDKKDKSKGIKGDDWTKIGSWRKANPNYGISVSKDFLEARRKQAIRDSRKAGTLRCKHLNEWVNARSAWMNMASWGNCTNRHLADQDMTGWSAVLGVDMASKIDIAGFAKLYFRDIDGKRYYRVFSENYLPEAQVQDPKKTHYRGWHKDGFIIQTDGNEIDFNTVQDDIESAAVLAGAMVGYDPFQTVHMSQLLREEGVPMVLVQQSVQNFSPAMKEIEAAVMAGRLEHDGNPVLTWGMSNVTAREDNKENVFPVKASKSSPNKIDPAVALIIAVCVTLGDGVEANPYAERGIISV